MSILFILLVAGFLAALASSNIGLLTKQLRRLLIPAPQYEYTNNIKTFRDVKVERVASELMHFVKSNDARQNPACPYPLGRFWWDIVDAESGDKNATLVLDYVSDINRYIGSSNMSYSNGHGQIDVYSDYARTGVNDSTNLQKFRMTLTLSWSSNSTHENPTGIRLESRE